jgi:hypothetical protein
MYTHIIYIYIYIYVYRGASWCSGAVARRLPTDTTRRNSIPRPILHTHIPLIVSRGACMCVCLYVCVYTCNKCDETKTTSHARRWWFGLLLFVELPFFFLHKESKESVTRHSAQKWAVHTHTFVCGGGGWVNGWCGQKRGWGGGAEEDK